MAKQTGLRYISDGTVWMVDGEMVPNRDLSAEEVREWGEATLLQSGLYERPARKTRPEEVKKDGNKLKD